MNALARRLGFPPGDDPGARAVRIVRAILLPVLLGLAAYLLAADRTGDLWKEAFAGKKLSLKECVRAGLHAAAVIDAGICLLLYLTARWWAAPAGVAPAGTGPAPAVGPGLACPRFWWAAMAAILLGATALRLPLAAGSLWWDEIWTLKNAVLGPREPDPAKPGQVRHREADWNRTLFYYAKPTNHVAFAVLSKTALRAWQKVAGRERWEFREPIFRLPSLVAGVGSLLVVGLLLRRWGWPAASLAAPLLLAIHPWHIRYSVDGRAFGLMFLLAALAALALTSALRGGTWKGWLGFGLCQMLLLWNFPYSLYLCATLGLAACGVVVAGALRDPRRWPQLGRLLVGQLAGLMLLLPLVLPHLPQILRWTDVEGNDMIDRRFLLELWSALSTGTPWRALKEPGTALYPGLEPWVQAAPWIGWAVFGLLPLLVVAGLFAVFRRDAVAGWISAALLVAAPAALIVAYAGTHYFYARYVIYALVPVALLPCVALEWIGARRPAWGWAALAAMVLAFAAAGTPQRGIYLTRPYAPIRDVARFLEDAAGPDGRGARCVGFNLGGDTPAIYFPHIEQVTDVPGLARVLAETRSDARPLYLFYGYSRFNRADEPDAFALLDDLDRLEKVATFEGIEPQFQYTVLRARPPRP